MPRSNLASGNAILVLMERKQASAHSRRQHRAQLEQLERPRRLHNNRSGRGVVERAEWWETPGLPSRALKVYYDTGWLWYNPISAAGAMRRSRPSAPSIWEAALITGTRSDLPGEVTAQVTDNVYDSPTGRYLVTPQGAKLIGTYDSQVAFGQDRLLRV
jgi:hypothetical protein